MNWIKNNPGFTFLFFILAIVSFLTFRAYHNDRNKIVEIGKQKIEIRGKLEQITDAISNLKTEINGVKANDSLRKLWQSKLYDSEKDLLDWKKELNDLNEETQAEIQSLWMHQMEYIAALIALIVAVVFFKTLDEKAKDKIQEEIAKITGKKLEDVKKNYDEYIRHKELKDKAKILVLNRQGTKLPDIFMKVMAFFGVNPVENADLININELSDYTKHLARLTEADVVVVENQVSDKAWQLPRGIPVSDKNKLEMHINENENELNAYITLKDILEGQSLNDNRLNIVQKVFPGFSRKKCNPVDIAMLLFEKDLVYKNDVLDREIIRRDLRFDVRLALNWMHASGNLRAQLIAYLGKIITKKDAQLDQLKNTLTMVELADAVCANGRTALLYYGKGSFPVDLVNPAYQHLITFANAPSQLYGNLLNMLKFKYEMERI